MTRILLRALNPVVFALLITIGVALQSSLFSSYPLLYLQPDVVLLGVIWCALKREFLEGGVLSLVFAEVAEIHSSGPAGIYLTTAMALYLLIRLISKRFVFTDFSSLIGFILGVLMVWKLLGLVVLAFLGESRDQWRHTMALLIPGAVMEGVAGAILYRGLEKFDWLTFKDPRSTHQTEDDVLLDEEGL
jgi:cell shape-determining protein MreD